MMHAERHLTKVVLLHVHRHVSLQSTKHFLLICVSILIIKFSEGGRATISGTKATGSWQALHLLPLIISGQPGCKQWSYSAFHHTEATSELCFPPVSYERLSTILALGRQREPTARGTQT